MSHLVAAQLTLWSRDFVGYRDALSAQQQAWSAGEVHGKWLPFPQLERDVLHGRACTDGEADLVMVPADWIPALAASGRIVPLGAAAHERGPWSASFDPPLLAAGQRWAAPYHDGPQLLFWRTDLYGDPDEQVRFRRAHGRELAPPRSWDELEMHARWFTRPEEGLWGTVFAGFPDGHNNVYDFVAQLWRYGGDLFDEAGRAAYASDAGVRAATWLRDIVHEACTPAAHDLDSVASGDEFAAGRVAVAVNWAGFTAMAQGEASVVRQRYACTTAFEASPTVNAFWAVAVTAGCGNPDAARAFVAHLGRPDMDRLTTVHGACGACLSSWRDPDILSRHPEQALFETAHARSRPLPPRPELPAVVAVLNAAVDDIVYGGADAAGRLREAGAVVDALGTSDTRGSI